MDSVAALVHGQGVTAAPALSAGDFRGVVQDRDTGAPLSGVQVYIVRTGIGALSDRSGRVQLSGIPPGPHKLSAELIGYRSVTIPIDVPPAGGLTGLLRMDQLSYGFCDLIWAPPGAGAVRVRAFDATTREPVAVPVTLRVSNGLQEWQFTGDPPEVDQPVAAAGSGLGPFVFEVSAPGYVPWLGITAQLPEADCPPPTSHHDVWLLPAAPQGR